VYLEWTEEGGGISQDVNTFISPRGLTQRYLQTLGNLFVYPSCLLLTFKKIFSDLLPAFTPARPANISQWAYCVITMVYDNNNSNDDNDDTVISRLMTDDKLDADFRCTTLLFSDKSHVCHRSLQSATGCATLQRHTT